MYKRQELIEIIVDGLLGQHRAFQPFLGDSFYRFLINFFEFFAVAVLLVCIIFLVRRNVINIKRFTGTEMSSWPKLDANLILVFEIILMLFLLNMNASDTAIQLKKGESVQYYFASSFFVPLYDSFTIESLHITERFFWWSHIIGVFICLLYTSDAADD